MYITLDFAVNWTSHIVLQTLGLSTPSNPPKLTVTPKPESVLSKPCNMEGRRLALIHSHLTAEPAKHTWFKPLGWGYKDTEFRLRNGVVEITGSRYLYSGKTLPGFKAWAEAMVSVDFSAMSPVQSGMQVDPPVVNEEFNRCAATICGEVVIEDTDRVFHSHGHTLQELFAVRYGKLPRVVDVVVYPSTHKQVEEIVQLAVRLNVVIIPYGGGTNVTQALQVFGESRSICSLDLSNMKKVLEVNKHNYTALVQAGIRGIDLEEQLSKYGLCCGHEPDSHEFSTLGGWISTRASGMKKNVYGNIEDIVLQSTIVTPIGTVERPACPRGSIGPDLNHLIFGHEGTLGVITQAIIRVRPKPESVEYDSILFPDFELGIQFMHSCAVAGLRPASIRLVDNQQFQFAMALKPAEGGLKAFMDHVKKWFVLHVKGFQPTQMCVCTLLFEGSKEIVALQMMQIRELAGQHKGLIAGRENGMRGYFLTYMIAYIRDFGMDYYLVGESFETSVPWDKVSLLTTSVKKCIEDSCTRKGVKGKVLVSSRISQIYDTGACVYIYFAFTYKGLERPAEVYTEIESEARVEIMRCGGSLSHHHGVGKLRKSFLSQAVGSAGVAALKTIKAHFDPTNIFACGNLV